MCRGCKTKRAKFVLHPFVRTSGVTPRLQKMGDGLPLCDECASGIASKTGQNVKKLLAPLFVDALKKLKAVTNPSAKG